MLVDIKLNDRIVEHKMLRIKYNLEEGFFRLRSLIVKKLRWTDPELIKEFCIGYFDVYLDLISIRDGEDLFQCNDHRLNYHMVKYIRLFVYRKGDTSKVIEEHRIEHTERKRALAEVKQARTPRGKN
ncbi:hypothetical protein CLIB1423_19S01090 [[Candida] railenensis]|uniref:Uncharacterized protein n=1 Tax=[Candida] railenensis TaxID=45579 RepID=A0A9P0QTS8_9ASCO|nr:hypothetical protein CLIB1423_19S01090 [[Candida] railenensis]